MSVVPTKATRAGKTLIANGRDNSKCLRHISGGQGGNGCKRYQCCLRIRCPRCVSKNQQSNGYPWRLPRSKRRKRRSVQRFRLPLPRVGRFWVKNRSTSPFTLQEADT